MDKYIKYEILPEHCREPMRRYLEQGIIPGDFLQAVICNDLVGAYKRADDINTARMRDYANFLYNEMPTFAWGNEQSMVSWSKMRKMARGG